MGEWANVILWQPIATLDSVAHLLPVSRGVMDMNRLQYAINLLESGSILESLAEFEEMALGAVDPEEKGALLGNTARCLIALRRLAEARERLLAASSLTKGSEISIYVEFQFAMLEWYEARPEKSLERLNRLVTNHGTLFKDPEHRELYEEILATRGVLLAQSGKFDEARPLLEESLAYECRNVGKPRVLLHLGLCYEKRGDNAHAEQYYLKAVTLSNDVAISALARYYLGRVYFTERAFAKALREFEECLPFAERARLDRANVLHWLKETARAGGLDASG
jgi:tetratricopeptide (TPR) repeat protein